MKLIIGQTNGRPDKNDLLLQDLVNARQWKQALVNCDKRLKKSKDLHLSFNKALILLHTPDKYMLGVTTLSEALTEPVTDVEILSSMMEAVDPHLIDSVPQLSTAWERAATARPKEASIASSWFWDAFVRSKYDAARKAAMVNMKRFPTNRDWYFRAIVCGILASSENEGPALNKQIVIKLVAVAVDNTQKGASDAARRLNSFNDLQLAIHIFKTFDMNNELLNLLQHDRTGLKSSLGGNAWDLAKYQIDVLRRLERWQDAWDFCSEILQDALSPDVDGKWGYRGLGDDVKVWSSLLEASAIISSASGTLDNYSKTSKLIQRFQDSYNAQIANMKLLSQHPDGPVQAELLSACFDFYCQYYDRQMHYSVLNPFLYVLSASNQKAFLRTTASHAENLKRLAGGTPSHAPSDSKSASKERPLGLRQAYWIAAEVGCLKQQYNLYLSRKSSRLEDVHNFVVNCLRLYKNSIVLDTDMPATDRRPGDDAAILAASACIYLGCRESSITYLLEAALVLEALLDNSKHNYDALLLLLLLYLRLGAITKAYECVRRLELKNLQGITTSWMQSERISTLHPHKSKVLKFDPASILNENLSSLQRKTERSLNMLVQTLDDGSWLSALQQHEFDQNFRNSIMRFIMVCELNRQLISGSSTLRVDIHNMLHVEHLSLSDTREKVACVNYGHYEQGGPEQMLSIGPPPDRGWVSFQLQLQGMKEMFQGSHTSIQLLVLAKAWSDDADHPDEPWRVSKSAGLTESECILAKLVEEMMKHVKRIDALNSKRITFQRWQELDNESLKSFVTSLVTSTASSLPQTKDLGTIAGLSMVDSLFLHKTYLSLETNSLAVGFLRWLTTVKDILKILTDLDTLVEKMGAQRKDDIKVIADSTMEMKKAMEVADEEHKLADYLLDQNIVMELSRIMGDERIAYFCTSYVESVVDALDGLG